MDMKKQPAQLEAYSSVSEFQDQMHLLYTGQDKIFSQLRCPNCKFLPIDPVECSRCQSTICKACLVVKRGNMELKNYCGKCQQDCSHHNQVHQFIMSAYEQATFFCPNQCGLVDISLKQIEQHLTQQCPQRQILCNNHCGKRIKVSQLIQHRATCQGQQCDKCKQRIKPGAEHCCITQLSNKIEDFVSKRDFFQQVSRIGESKVDQSCYTRTIKQLESELYKLKGTVAQQTLLLTGLQRQQPQIDEEQIEQIVQKVMNEKQQEEAKLEETPGEDLFQQTQKKLEDFQTKMNRDINVRIDKDIEQFEERFSQKFGKKFNQLGVHVERLRKSVRKMEQELMEPQLAASGSSKQPISEPQSSAPKQHGRGSSVGSPQDQITLTTNRQQLPHHSPNIMRRSVIDEPQRNRWGEMNRTEEQKSSRNDPQNAFKSNSHSPVNASSSSRIEKKESYNYDPIPTGEFNDANCHQVENNDDYDQMKGDQANPLKNLNKMNNTRGQWSLSNLTPEEQDSKQHQNEQRGDLGINSQGPHMVSSGDNLTPQYKNESSSVTTPIVKQPDIQTKGTLRKLQICGLSDGSSFCYPPMKENSKVLTSNLHCRQLTGMRFNSGYAIYSLKMVFTDTASPQFGSDVLNDFKEIPYDDKVVQIEIRATSLRVARVSFKLKSGAMVEASGSNTNGQVTKFKIESNESIVGCYGFLSGNQNIVGIGFIVWSPLGSQ